MSEITTKHIILGIVALLVLGAIFYPEKMQEIASSFSFQQDIEENQGTAAPGPVQTGQGVTNIIAIASANLKATFADMLNETYEPINPTFYVWREGATQPTTVSVSNGAGTISLAPGEKIQYAAGSDGTYYWVKDTFTMGTADTPLEVKLYTIPSASGVTIKVFDTSYHDLSNGAYNITVGAGQDVDLQIQLDVVDEYTAIRHPHICVAYNDSLVNKVKMAGLLEVDAPSRLVSGLDQCFDTGVDYLTDSDTKLTYDAKVDILPGADPTEATSSMTWYVIDKDIWYQNGKEYFVNPLNNANMGATVDVTNWKTTTYFA